MGEVSYPFRKNTFYGDEGKVTALSAHQAPFVTAPHSDKRGQQTELQELGPDFEWIDTQVGPSVAFPLASYNI